MSKQWYEIDERHEHLHEPVVRYGVYQHAGGMLIKVVAGLAASDTFTDGDGIATLDITPATVFTHLLHNQNKSAPSVIIGRASGRLQLERCAKEIEQAEACADILASTSQPYPGTEWGILGHAGIRIAVRRLEVHAGIASIEEEAPSTLMPTDQKRVLPWVVATAIPAVIGELFRV